jgi:excisionase family DNA binding protein
MQRPDSLDLSLAANNRSVYVNADVARAPSGVWQVQAPIGIAWCPQISRATLAEQESGSVEHNDREGFMPLASNNERTATVEVARPSERLIRPFQGSERLMTLLEVSQLLGVPVATLYRWRHRGEGPSGYRIGRHVRYRRAAVEAWIETQADQWPIW